MLSDRPYMRANYPRERTSILIWMLSAMVAGFAIQAMSAAWFKGGGPEQALALSGAALERGYLWTLVTYPLLHDGPLHLLAVVLSLFFVGRELSGPVGEKRLAWLTILSTAGAGLTWLAFNVGSGNDLLGATAILWTYFTVFACLQPDRELSFLVFFVVPVRLRPKYIAWTMLGVGVLGLVATEILPNRFENYNVPHSAHLGGMLVGWIYFRYFLQSNRRPATSDLQSRERVARDAVPAAEQEDLVGLNSTVSPKKDLRAEVDRILDKINSQGFGALTAEEKRVLADARDSLTRR